MFASGAAQERVTLFLHRFFKDGANYSSIWFALAVFIKAPTTDHRLRHIQYHPIFNIHYLVDSTLADPSDEPTCKLTIVCQFGGFFPGSRGSSRHSTLGGGTEFNHP